MAARGIHVDNLDLVVNVDPPTDPKDYLHRGGRSTACCGRRRCGRGPRPGAARRASCGAARSPGRAVRRGSRLRRFGGRGPRLGPARCRAGPGPRPGRRAGRRPGAAATPHGAAGPRPRPTAGRTPPGRHGRRRPPGSSPGPPAPRTRGWPRWRWPRASPRPCGSCRASAVPASRVPCGAWPPAASSGRRRRPSRRPHGRCGR
ncbi:helicase-related protein [Streptomyces sp. NPDC060054]|uniref:helicase-related protein n=1 Tax=Streptomyces sp. NPDC060054 TaxID=3347048 RepID=UPI0036867D9D